MSSMLVKFPGGLMIGYMEPVFTECLLLAGHCPECFSGINSLCLVYYPHSTDDDTEAQTCQYLA